MEAVKIIVEIEIDIKNEIEDVYFKQEPMDDSETRERDGESMCEGALTSSEHHIDPSLKQLETSAVCEEDGNELITRNKRQTKSQNKFSSVKKHRQNESAKTTGPYLCEVCNKEFQHISRFNRHTPIHTGQRPYICEVCGKRFIESGYLKLHMLIHKGEKVYPCQLCDKRFTHGSNLKRHQLTHTGERPFACAVCSKRFSDRSTLKQHRRIHDGDRPFVCDLCDRGFPQSSQLKKHMLKHGAQSLSSEFQTVSYVFPRGTNRCSD